MAKVGDLRIIIKASQIAFFSIAKNTVQFIDELGRVSRIAKNFSAIAVIPNTSYFSSLFKAAIAHEKKVKKANVCRRSGTTYE